MLLLNFAKLCVVSSRILIRNNFGMWRWDAKSDSLMGFCGLKQNHKV